MPAGSLKLACKSLDSVEPLRVIKESWEEWHLGAQKQGVSHVYLQPVVWEVESVQEVLEALVGVRL